MKRKILIASLLKPVNDIRSYEKFAKSLDASKLYDVSCSGFPPETKLEEDKIHFLQLKKFNKNGFGRVLARFQMLKIYVKLKPELIIVNSTDLLLISALYRIIFGSKIVYDIRENYFRNLYHQKNYIWGIRHLLAIVVRVKETLTSPLFGCFFLAEKIYASQLNFIGKRYIIIENKSLDTKITSSYMSKNSTSHFLICGTITKEYGVFEGLEFFKNIAKLNTEAKLNIIGHCPTTATYNQLIYLTKNYPSIKLEISNNPIPHATIEAAIMNASIGLLPYLPNKSTEGKWPTKLYEFMSYKLPFIIQENSLWDEMILKNNTGLSFDFTNQSYDKIQLFWKQFQTTTFFTKEFQSDVHWKSQEALLLCKVANIFKS